MCSFSPLCLVYFINNNYYYSTLETDVCVWRYAPLVMHATQEEEEEVVFSRAYLEQSRYWCSVASVCCLSSSVMYVLWLNGAS